MLKVSSKRDLKEAIDTAEKFSPNLIQAAEDISRKFTKTFTLFASCHNIYNSGQRLSEEDIGSLGE